MHVLASVSSLLQSYVRFYVLLIGDHQLESQADTNELRGVCCDLYLRKRPTCLLVLCFR